MRKVIIFPLLYLAMACSSSQDDVDKSGLIGKEGCTVSLSDNYDADAVVDNGSCSSFTCSKCTYVIPANQNTTDGAPDKLNFKPGDVICLDAAIKYGNLRFINLNGTADKPIVIANCGGVVTIDASGKGYGIKTEYSKYFKITGVGSGGSPYGIKLFGATQGMQLQSLSTNYEISNLEIYNMGFAGIMAKTDPSCDDATIRGNFTMRDVSIHHNYVHDTGGEGFYVGNSFYKSGVNVSGCGVRLPHDVVNIRIYQNQVRNTGWDAIQLGAAVKGAEVFNNTIENFGTLKKQDQWSGIQLGEGTGGLCYNNYIKNGSGQGLNVLGYGDNLVYNNIIVNAGQNGIFCDARYSPGDGFKFMNNTIVTPGLNGIRIWAKLSLNVIVNNVIVMPGSLPANASKPDNAFLYTSTDVKIDLSNNYYAKTVAEAKFKNAGAGDFSLVDGSPLIDKGRDVSVFKINVDYTGASRPKRNGFDIGAYELQ